MQKSLRTGAAAVLLLSLFNLAPMQVTQAAYAFSTHTFTPCGTTGVNGPSQASCRSAYSTAWDESDSNFTVVNGIQIWTVPATGSYSITAAGANGGNGRTGQGGSGAVISGNFSLTEGQKIRILVGQSGTTNSQNGGGGGGTFVVKDSDNSTNGIYVIAGGGGGGGYTTNGANVNGVTTQSGQSGFHGNNQTSLNNAVTSGNGGLVYDYSGGGGGGFTGDGGSSTYVCTNVYGVGGKSFTNGGAGGSGSYAGGFGGGGSGDWCNWTGAGGGGGYSGGSGGYWYGSGGGGGSYNNGTNQTNTSGGNLATGYVTITSLGPELTTFAAASAITNASTLSYTVNFGQSVTGLTASDFSVSGSGSSSCTIGAPSGTGNNYTITLTGCSPGTVILTLATNSVINSSSQSGPTANNVAGTVVIDRTAPTISTLSAPANKTYTPSETPTFSVVFSESITVVGSPRLQLTVGSLTRYANYVSMSDSKTALFRYTVGAASGEFDTDGIELNTTFDVNGGRIDDLAGNSMSLTTITAPVLTSVLIAQKASAPTITSITPGSSQLTVNFNAGATNGAPITNYKYSLNGGAFTAASPVDTVTPLVITGLTNGTGYTIRILAVTLAGDGDSSTAVTETPSAILVTGDSTIVLTYGTSGSTGNYSASGGTNVFTWSLGSVISGVSLSGTSVSVANTLNAGTYTQTVRATDGASAVGSKQLTITINKASSTISLALQSGGNSTPVGQSPVITITTARAGTVVFTAGGQVIAACSSISIASTSGTCTLPAPGGTGSLSLDAVFTPSSGNYDSATASISITIVDGVSTVTLSLAGGVVEVPKGQSINIIAAIDQAGKVSFYVDGKRLPGCFNKTFSAGNATCSWKPATQKQVSIRATLNPTNSVYNNSSSTLNVWVKRRAGLR
jgi:hypothetical protein